MAGFVDLLFADQDLEDLLVQLDLPPLSSSYVARARLWEGRTKEAVELASDVKDDPFAPLVVAAAKIRSGALDDAKAVLLAIDAAPDAETRLRLWVWCALRALGEVPPPAVARDLLGVVLEVPVRDGLDVLAAYADGRARYANHGGAVVVHEPSGRVDAPIADLLRDASVLTSRVSTPRLRSPLPLERVRFTGLTRSGLHVAEVGPETIEDRSHPLGVAFGTAGRLLGVLTTRPQGR